MIFNKFLYRHYDSDEQISAKYGTMVSNASFVGMPIAQSLYGANGLLYASIYVLPQRFLMWSYGLSLYTKQNDPHKLKKIITHPCVVAIFIGIIVGICYNFGIYLSKGISKTLKAIGGCSTTLCLIIIGTIVSEVEIKELFNKKAILFSFYRLFLIPFVILILTSFLPIDPLSRNVCVLLTSIPAATTTVILAQKYHVNEKFASQLVICSTIFSLVSLPCIMYLLKILQFSM